VTTIRVTSEKFC